MEFLHIETVIKTMIGGNGVLITSTSTSSNVLFFSGFNLWHRIVTVFSFGVNDELEWFELEEVLADELDFRAIIGVSLDTMMAYLTFFVTTPQFIIAHHVSATKDEL